jgi:hypothetical protein
MALDQCLRRQQTQRKIRKARKLRAVFLGGLTVRLDCPAGYTDCPAECPCDADPPDRTESDSGCLTMARLRGVVDVGSHP